METNNKPDFEKMFSSWHPVAVAEHLWNHEVIPRDAKIAQLEVFNTKLRDQLVQDVKEISALKSELDKAVELLYESMGYFEFTPSSRPKIREIKDFIKDKR